MARLSPDALSKHIVAQPTTQEPQEQQAAARQAQVLPLREVRSGANIGWEMDARGRQTKREVPLETTPRLDVEIRYEDFLVNHLTRLAKAFEANSWVKEAIRPEHQQEVLLYEKFYKDGKFDEEGIRTYLQTADGRQSTTFLMDRLDFELGNGIGLNPTMDPHGERTLTSQPQRTPFEQGFFNRFRENLRDRGYQMRLGVGSMAGTIPALAAYTAAGTVGGPEGAALAAGIAVAVEGVGYAAVRGVQAIRNSWNRGSYLDLHPNADIFNALKANTAEQAYFLHVLNLDLEHLALDANDRLVVQDVAGGGATELLRSNKDFRELQNEVSQHALARRAFFESIGVRPNSLDANPYQYVVARLGGATDTQPQMSGDYYAKEVLDRFDELGGLVAGNVPDTLDHIDRAIQEVGNKYAVKACLEELNASKSSEASVLAAKKSGLESEEAKTARAKDAEERKKKMNEEKEKLTPQKELHKTYEEKRSALEAIVLQESRTLLEQHKVIIPPGVDFITAITGEIGTIDTYLNTNAFTVERAGGPVTVHGIDEAIDYITSNMDAIVVERYTTIMAARGAAVIGAREPELLPTQLRASLERQIQLWKEQKTALEQKRAGIAASRDRYYAAQRDPEQAERQILENAPKQLNELIEAYQSIIAPATAHPGTILTPADLQNLTVEEILIRVTNGHGRYRLAYRTPEQKAEVHLRVVRAKTEAQSRYTETYDTSPANDIDSFNNIVSAGGTLTPSDLSSRSRQELLSIFRVAAGPYVGIPGALGRTDEQIVDEAMREARKQLRIRDRVYTELRAKDLEAQVVEEDKLIEKNEEEVKKTGEKIEVTQLAMKRLGTAASEAYDITRTNGDRVTKLTDTALIVAADTTYTEKERGVPKGYCDVIDILFDYQKDANRGDLFEKIKSILPPQKLAELLDKSLGFGLGPALTLNNVLTGINGAISIGTMRSSELHKAFVDIIDRLEAEANAVV